VTGLLDGARGLVKRGVHVFPVHYPVECGGRLHCSCGNVACKSPAKHPFGRHVKTGLREATIEMALIEYWWGTGEPLNIGARTGAESGVVVLDVDPRHGGDETLRALEQRYGPLPTTWRFLSGGGGEHVLFRHPGYRVQNSTGETGPLGQGLDVRGDGGYIIAPPSLHISGRQYAAAKAGHPDEVELAPLPPWLDGRLHQTSTPRCDATAMEAGWRKLFAEGVSEGCRNSTVARITGHFLRHYIDPYVVLDVLRCWNACRCRPPLDEDELVRIVNSIAGRELARRRARHD
jgi:putative DNA primase/helicase